MNAVSIRGDWVGRTIDGRFPLLEWLGGSDSSGIFLTEIGGSDHPHSDREPWPEAPEKAAIRLIPASPRAEDRLAIWSAAASLSHPHLARIFHSGRAEIDEIPVVYVVTELAEEVLSQILPERPLTQNETREMLPPILDALSYLYGKGYVHGHLKPSNVLVIENEVKLSSDGLLVAGKPNPEVPSTDLYNAPELSHGPVARTVDIWSLGVTLVEALSQEVPIWDAANEAEPEVPASLPDPFSEIVRECLHPDPARRCSLNDIRSMLDGKWQSAPAPLLHAPQDTHRLIDQSARRRIPLVPLIVGLILLVAIIVGLQMHSRKTNTEPPTTEATQQAPPAEPGPHPESAPPSTQNGNAPGKVINRDIPDVPHAASNTIHGTVSVTVRVSVDSTGKVSNAELATHGPSAYFARIALNSARNWKFEAAKRNGNAVGSTWLLRYSFRRDGTEVAPTEAEP